MIWEEAAQYCEDTYGVFVDWEERFFICPICEEPLYECDFDHWDICPVCEFNFITAEMSE